MNNTNMTKQTVLILVWIFVTNNDVEGEIMDSMANQDHFQYVDCEKWWKEQKEISITQILIITDLLY